MYSTVMISTDKGIGTGFFFYFNYKDKYIPVIITNCHVINDSSVGKFKFHSSKIVDNKNVPGEEMIEIKIDDFESRWIKHPDPKIDLCAMPVNYIFEYCKKQSKNPFTIYLTENFIPTNVHLNDFDVVEDILMFGYPNGLVDLKNDLPLIRRGITATHPAIDFNDESIGVIDAACFPGSSGSPIILHQYNKPNKKGIVEAGLSSYFLLGILFSGPYMKINGEIEIIPIPMNSTPKSQMMIHLGYYIKSKELLVLKENFLKINNL